MNDRPLTWFLVTALGLWGLWLWRTRRFGSAAAPGGALSPGTAPGGGPLFVPPLTPPGPAPPLQPAPGSPPDVLGGYGLDSLRSLLG